MMNSFRAELSEESITALRGLLGEVVYLIYGPAFEVVGRYISSDSFSLALEDKSWLNLTTEEVESDVDGYSFWQLSAIRSENPKDLESETERVEVSGMSIDIEVFVRSPSMIILSPASASIEKICVYQDIRPIAKTDTPLLYGEAIIFHRDNGKQFCIAAESYGTGESLDFTEDQEGIDLLTRRFTLQQEII
jgi:hypothetical protein